MAVAILPKEWDAVVADFEGFQAELKEKISNDAREYSAWRSRSAARLPAGAFVWVEEFESDFAHDFSVNALTLPNERVGDRVLNYTPLLGERERAMILARLEALGPEDWTFWLSMPEVKRWEACALSLSLDPLSLRTIADGWMVGSGDGPFFETDSFPTGSIQREFEKRLRLVNALATRGEFTKGIETAATPGNSGIVLCEFAVWADSIPLALPIELKELAQRSAIQCGSDVAAKGKEEWTKASPAGKRELIEEALRKHGNIKTLAAKSLGISRQRLSNLKAADAPKKRNDSATSATPTSSPWNTAKKTQ
jgi:hypothetical protein